MTSNLEATSVSPHRDDRWIGWVVIVLAIFTVIANLYAIDQDRELVKEDEAQRLCIAKSFTDLTEALQVRSSLAGEISVLKDKQTDLLVEGRDLNNDQLNNLVDLLIVSANDPTRTEAERAERLRAFIDNTRRFQDRGKAIEAEIVELHRQIAEKTQAQAKTPVPPYPEGKCD